MNEIKYFDECLDTTDEILHYLNNLNSSGRFVSEVINNVINYVDELNWDYVQKSVKAQR